MRTLWVVICVLFALFWITVGWIILPIVNIFLFFGSLLVMIPALIGRTERIR